MCLREQESFLTAQIAPASRAVDASPSLSLSGRVKCIGLILCLSFYEWRCIYPDDQMILAPFLKNSSPDRAPGRFADYPFVPKHPNSYVLLTTVLGPLRSRRDTPTTAKNTGPLEARLLVYQQGPHLSGRAGTQSRQDPVDARGWRAH